MPNSQVHWKIKLGRIIDFDRKVWGSKLDISTFDFIKILAQIITVYQKFNKILYINSLSLFVGAGHGLSIGMN
jgi:hypothetical protein